jgi:hypothetical protein
MFYIGLIISKKSPFCLLLSEKYWVYFARLWEIFPKRGAGTYPQSGQPLQEGDSACSACKNIQISYCDQPKFQAEGRGGA